jgi:hypothetical protein
MSYSRPKEVGDYSAMTEMAALQELSIVEPPIARACIALTVPGTVFARTMSRVCG